MKVKESESAVALASAAGEGEPSTGGFVERSGERWYAIDRLERLPPFLVNVVSSTDHWMFVGSNGSVTAGRRNADNALFPYCTQDKLLDSAGVTGGVSQFWLRDESSGESRLWEPYAPGDLAPGASRRLLKNDEGTQLEFEERLSDWGLRFTARWSFSSSYGFIRSVGLGNEGERRVSVRALDGLRNLTPYGLDQAFTNQFSNLADAYKKGELARESGLGIFYLSSIPTDRAEPSEGLKATIAWSPEAESVEAVLLCCEQVEAFRAGRSLRSEEDARGRRCAFLQERRFALEPSEERRWRVVADINQDATAVVGLQHRLETDRSALGEDLGKEARANTEGIRARIAEADGLQRTGLAMRDARHRSNALFNIMRGGIFASGYDISVADFRRYARVANPLVAAAAEGRLDRLGERSRASDLIAWADEMGDPDLRRLAREYLPLTFSRRHGDPSRPWNKFSIETQDEAGNPALAYQGNWRDIFQNWEPLGYSFPEYIESMIERFLNASTADGYNPYRLTRDGFDWETIDPDEPWSNIGYWGDHQLIYLLRLLEARERFYPGELGAALSDRRFVYAHVPYRIRGFEETLKNPRSTVDYDVEAAEEMARLAERLGADGKLLRREDGALVRATLLEKLLTPLLAKLSNFVPGGGIWMNTQRPEWNDANNALVGYGVSVVTLCYARRYVAFLMETLRTEGGGASEYELEASLLSLLEELDPIFGQISTEAESVDDDGARFEAMSRLGGAGERYRARLYAEGLSSKRGRIERERLLRFLDTVDSALRSSIAANRRSEGLYHSYNLLRIDRGARRIGLDRLPVMLEGQVAALSSGCLKPSAAVELMASLRRSPLYREDVDSYLLYPDRELPRFLEKNRITASELEATPCLKALADRGEARILRRDVRGDYHFNGSFRNSADLRTALIRWRAESGETFGDEEVEACVACFETVFDHRRFLGRSGTFFAYEGLGSVYWHMVSKLALAAQENALRAWREAGEEGPDFRALRDAYFRVVDGLGFDKSPEAYGAFPVDAYSHTPRHAGAQQPGMTGQVKEDLLGRWAELGVRIEGGRIRLEPCLLQDKNFLDTRERFRYRDVRGEERSLELRTGELAFTFCQTPVLVRRGERSRARILEPGGSWREEAGLALGEEDSLRIFQRCGCIALVEFEIGEGAWR